LKIVVSDLVSSQVSFSNYKINVFVDVSFLLEAQKPLQTARQGAQTIPLTGNNGQIVLHGVHEFGDIELEMFAALALGLYFGVEPGVAQFFEFVVDD